MPVQWMYAHPAVVFVLDLFAAGLSAEQILVPDNLRLIGATG